jgi:predicted lipoprotein with Yx(FWY)xxD motif
MRRLVMFAIAVAVAAITAAGALGAGTTTVKTRSASGLGKILVNSKSVTLYLFEKDAKNKSRCPGACATNWPPLIAKGKLAAAGGVRAAHLGRITRSDGRKQVTYYGHPLYTFVGDGNTPGKTAGQELDAFGAEWYVLGTNGKKRE